MTPDECRARIVEIERWANARVEQLTAVRASGKPGCGESGALYDAVASMAKAERSADEIAFIHLAVRFLTQCVEADNYRAIDPEITRPEFPFDDPVIAMRLREELACWESRWKT